MSFVISDRVKETTVTSGTGTITLTGALGGFRPFSSAIGDGNVTYYVIENEADYEIGIGTYTSSGNTLSRDTVLQSSNSNSKINLSGVSFVFCAVPADKTVFINDNGVIDLVNTDIKLDGVSIQNLNASGDVGVSGLLTLRREAAGNFFHAFVDDAHDKTIGLYHDATSSPDWRLGLKNSPSDQTAAPTFAYVYAGDGNIGLYSNSITNLNLTHSAGFNVIHKGGEIIKSSYDTGSLVTSFTAAQKAIIIKGANSQSADMQQWVDSSDTLLANVAADGSITGNSITATGNLFAGTKNVLTEINTSSASGVTISGYFESRTDSNAASIVAVSGLASDSPALSGYFESRADTNAADIVVVSGLLYNDASLSGYFESRVDSSDSSISNNSSSITANSGYFQSRADSSDSNITANSGYFESRVDTNATANTNLINSVSGWAGSTITNEVASLVDSAPGTLDTLNELAAAINDDANIASTLTTLISNTSGNLQGQITSNDTDISTVSGLLYNDASLSGYFEGRVDTNETNIATNVASINTVSGLLYDDSAVSGYFESRVDTNATNIISVSGSPNTFNIIAGDGNDYTIDGMGLNNASDPTMYLQKGHTYKFNKTFSGHPFRVSATDGGSVYSDADSNNIEIGSAAGSVTFEVPQNAPDKLYYYCTSHPSNMKGLIYTTTDGSTSGYFESRVDSADSSIAATSGYFESRPITLQSGVPTDKKDKLYNDGYYPKFNGSGIPISSPITNASGVNNIMIMSEATYTALGTKDANTLYFLV